MRWLVILPLSSLPVSAQGSVARFGAVIATRTLLVHSTTDIHGL